MGDVFQMKSKYCVGKKRTRGSMIGVTIIWMCICLFLTRLGQQPFWLFDVLFLLGFFFVLPVCMSDYWLVRRDKIVYTDSQSDKKKFNRFFNVLLTNSDEKYANRIFFKDISSVEIVYINQSHYGPYSSDKFYLQVNTVSRKSIQLDMMIVGASEQLPSICSLLKKKGITIIDKDNILEVCEKKESIYEYVRQK